MSQTEYKESNELNETKEINEINENESDQIKIKQSFEGIGIEITSFENNGCIVYNADETNTIYLPNAVSVEDVVKNVQDNFNKQLRSNPQINQLVRMEMERALSQMKQSPK